MAESNLCNIRRITNIIIYMNIEPFITALSELAKIPDWIIIALALVVAGFTQIVKLIWKKQKEYGIAYSWLFGLIFGTIIVMAASPENVWIAITGILLTASLISLAGSGAYSQLKGLQKKSKNGEDIAPADVIFPIGEGFQRVEVPESPTIGVQK